MTVHQFPGINRELQDLHRQTDDLDEIYTAMNKLHEHLNELELRAAEMEAHYDIELDKYIRRVGVGNCPVHLLNYSTNGIDYYYEWKEYSEQEKPRS